MVKSEFIYELKTKFEYAYKGNQQEAQFITFKAPTLKNRESCAKIRQIFTKVFMEGAEKYRNSQRQEPAAETKEADLTGQDYIHALYASDQSAPEVLDLFVNILKSDRALIDGETRFTDSLLEKLSIEEIEEMTGEYVSNFILASLLK